MIGLAIIVGLLILGIIYEQVARRKERTYTLPGRLVDVGGYRLHVTDRGEGGPTLLIIPGAGDSSYSWQAIQRELAATNRVLSFDRAGLGSSEAGPAPDPERSLVEIERLLAASGVSGPVILVGHSLGGLFARMYATKHPEQVAGLVLVDSTHEFLRDDKKFKQGFAAIGVMLRIMKALSPIGLPRFLGEVLGVMPMYPERANYVKQLSREEYRLWAASVYRNTAQEGGIGEFGAVDTILAASYELRKPDGEQPQFGDLPMVVMSNPGFGQGWITMHRELAGRSTNSSHRITVQKGHNVEMHSPELVIDAIRHVVAEVRRRSEEAAG